MKSRKGKNRNKAKKERRKEREKKTELASKKYSTLYKEALGLFVTSNTSNVNKTLYELIDSKMTKIFLQKSRSPEEDIYLKILSFSEYFIKENDYINEDYFNLIKEDICKIFYELIKNPSLDQYNIFLKSFENLCSCGNIIFLICKKLTSKNPENKEKPVYLFFKIILKERYNILCKKFSFRPQKDHKELLNTLGNFIRIKYNYNKVTENEVIDLLREPKKVLSESIVNPEEASKTIENENKNNELNDTKMDNKINNINIAINMQEKNDFFNYLNKMEDKYKKLEYDTPVLNYLIEKKIKLRETFFRYVKDKRNFVDHLYDYLVSLIWRLNSDLIALDDNKVGYICYYDKYKTKFKEGIYANIDIDFLYEKIVSNENFPEDDLYSPNENIARNAFKSRALSFEYYINNEIILNKLEAKERQRIIYIFRNVKEIENIENCINNNEKEKENDKDNLIEYEEQPEFDIVEVDGVILEDKDKNILLNDSFFIPDPVYKFDIFTDKFNGKESLDSYNFSKNTNEFNEDNMFYLDGNCLCVIEIKNQFPPYVSREKKKEIANEINIEQIKSKDKSPMDFYNVVKSLAKKALIFREMFTQLGKRINSIKLVLFYDAVKKSNYKQEMNKALDDSFGINDKELIKMLEFQVIYIKSSYLAGGIFSYKSEILKIKEENSILHKNLEDLKNQMEGMKNSIKAFQKYNEDKFEEINNAMQGNSQFKLDFDKEQSQIEEKIKHEDSECKQVESQKEILVSKTEKINDNCDSKIAEISQKKDRNNKSDKK